MEPTRWGWVKTPGAVMSLTFQVGQRSHPCLDLQPYRSPFCWFFSSLRPSVRPSSSSPHQGSRGSRHFGRSNGIPWRPSGAAVAWRFSVAPCDHVSESGTRGFWGLRASANFTGLRFRFQAVFVPPAPSCSLLDDLRFSKDV